MSSRDREDSISVEETNKLRAQLGLKPLQLSSSPLEKGGEDVKSDIVPTREEEQFTLRDKWKYFFTFPFSLFFQLFKKKNNWFLYLLQAVHLYTTLFLQKIYSHQLPF